MARLSTHVLDITCGKPARAMRVELNALRDGQRRRVAIAVTNADGRCDEPLLAGSAMEVGVYELSFFAGEYFRAQGIELGPMPFLDEIVVRFGLDDASRDYHVPLLLSPFGYSTYRGS
jgi:5-hydroxyisourate hydrolase